MRASVASSRTRKPTPPFTSLPDVVHAPRTDAVYNCHGYLTKVPVQAVVPFIEAFTGPGDLVIDMFAGSGMTGLAAASLGRRCALSDISVLGQHIGTGYLTHAPRGEVVETARRVIEHARARIGDLYATTRVEDGAGVEMIRTIWSFIYECPSCREPLTYFEFLDEGGRAGTACPKCAHPFERKRWRHTSDMAVRVVVPGTQGRQVEQPVQVDDLARIARAGKDRRLERVPSATIHSDREMFGRSGLRRSGITETRQFFSDRNAIALLELWKAIADVRREDVRAKLRFAFTAALTRASRRYQWGPKRPLNAQNQTYYVAPVYFEWNVFELFERKVEAALRSDEVLFEAAPLFLSHITKSVSYDVASANALRHLDDDSVDFVFTDPPFGSNIFYSDMSLFHEAWLGSFTEDAHEAVVHTSGPRKKDSARRYEDLLRGAFREAFRVLKPGRFMSVVFGNSNGYVWALLQRCLRDSGFSNPLHVAILDKGQRSVKGLNSGSEGVVTVDLVLSVQKPEGRVVDRRETRAQPTENADSTVEELLASAAERLDNDKRRNPSYIYAAILREAIEKKRSLDGLHYSDVLVGLRQAGARLDPKKGLLVAPIDPETLRGRR